MVVRENWQIRAEDDRCVVDRRKQSGDRHGLGTAGELPEQLVAAADGIRSTRRRLGGQRVRELDAVHRLVIQAGALGDVELVPVAVAGSQTLVALTRLVERIEVHYQVQLVV